MFSGWFGHTIDGKGRVSVPAQFRDKLAGDPRLVLAPYVACGQHCLDVYPPAEWQVLLDKFAAVPKFTAQAGKFEMGYLGRSHRCDIDAAGRILVPPMLRNYAQLKKDVVFLGANTRFRMVAQELWAKLESEIDAEAVENTGRSIYEDLGF